MQLDEREQPASVSELGDCVRKRVVNCVWLRVWGRVRNRVEERVEARVWNRVGGRVGGRVRERVQAAIANKVREVTNAVR